MKITHALWAEDEEARRGKPVIVALHGRGADERSMLGLAPLLPSDTSLVSLRAPIDSGTGFAWFANRGIGRPIEESIKEVGAAVSEWLDEHVSTPAFLFGFSGGTAMAGGLLFAEPTRYAGAVLLSGTLPWDAGYATPDGLLSGAPIFWANDPADEVIPRELVSRSESWLVDRSGALLDERHYPGAGHSISKQELIDINSFLRPLVAAAR